MYRYIIGLYYGRITELNLSGRNLTVLPDLSLYTNLQRLYCYNNQLTSLNNLPPNLQILYCWNNKITSLDHLPSTLQIVWCSDNQLTSLDNLPPNLRIFNCFPNPIYTICNETYGYPSIEKFKKYNEIKRMEKECCPLLK